MVAPEATQSHVRQPRENAVEVGARVGNETPFKAKLGRDRLHQLDVETARCVAVHELEGRIGQS